ncbi:unnamed protein product, partial [Ceratitis capitata]
FFRLTSNHTHFCLYPPYLTPTTMASESPNDDTNTRDKIRSKIESTEDYSVA